MGSSDKPPPRGRAADGALDAIFASSMRHLFSPSAAASTRGQLAVPTRS